MTRWTETELAFLHEEGVKWLDEKRRNPPASLIREWANKLSRSENSVRGKLTAMGLDWVHYIMS